MINKALAAQSECHDTKRAGIVKIIVEEQQGS
jgi:hypothetical protein